jgi:hypothetical protein
MFDIKEYYTPWGESALPQSIPEIESGITFDIDEILDKKIDSLYLKDRYRYQNKIIDIIYPREQYPGRQILISPDRVRFLLSFYPVKSDFSNINKIVIRPKYVEIGDVELVALYLRSRRVLVYYLSHPHFYKMGPDDLKGIPKFRSVDLQNLIDVKRPETNDRQELLVHPIWHLLHTIDGGGDDNRIDKFLVKRNGISPVVYETLCDISFFYSNRGY